MLVKMIDGANAGKIIDLANDVALEFLRQGRAARAFDDQWGATPAPVALALIVPRGDDGPPADSRKKKARDGR